MVLSMPPGLGLERFAAYITRIGFTHSRYDSSLFIYRQGTDSTYLLLYVDGIVLTASFEVLLQQIIGLLHQEFSMMDIGLLNYFMGNSVVRNSSGMFLSQRKYAFEILERAHMVGCNPSQNPVDTESKLGADGDPVSDPTIYQSLAGALQYLTFTCPDISYAVQQVPLYMYDPQEPHFSALDLKMRIGLVVLLLEDRLRVIVYFLATTYSLGLLNLLIENLLRELHTPLSSATLVYCNIVSAIYLSSNPVQHQRTKHIEIDIHFAQDLVAADQVRVLHVLSRYLYADIFTKGLPSALFDEFRTSMSVWCLFAQTAGEC
ncbi:ribonuclease H-like domain-containing protein [Tanacetum coccineum]